jgi:hypothetical protein
MMDDLDRYLLRKANPQKLRRRLGIGAGTICICGEIDQEYFEDDHDSGRNHSDSTRPFCVKCHRKRTIRQRTEHPPMGKNPTNVFEVDARALLGQADYLEMIVEWKRDLAERLLNLADRGNTDIGD